MEATLEKTILSKTLSLFPVPLRLVVTVVKIGRLWPKFGFVGRGDKSYFIIGGFKYFIGLRLVAVKVVFRGF